MRIARLNITGKRKNSLACREMARTKKTKPIPAYPEDLEGGDNGEDWISRLPDEIIVCILSLLTVQEAMVTGVLSRRWRHMWKFMSSLDFEAQKKLDDRRWHIDRPGFIDWVNEAMKSYQAETIDRLRIRFDLFFMEGNVMYNWIDFAIDKRVKSFEMDFSRYEGSPQYRKLRCCLRDQLWHPCDSPGYQSLTDLKLSSIDVNGEYIEYLLYLCTALERLSILASETLVELKVARPSPSLKYLMISGCNNMQRIEICAENLISLNYSGPNIDLPLKSFPLLNELFVGGGYCKFFVDNILQFSNTLSGLESLGLDMHDIQNTIDFSHIPVLSHLKQLDVKLDARVEESLLGLTSLIKVSPSLQRFTLWLYCQMEGDREIQVVEKCCHNNLKVVEFYGFIGRAVDLELATYFIENAKALEKIVIDRRDPSVIGRPLQFKEDRMKISARKQANLLRKKVARGGPSIIIH